ncbi:hypothetical protein A6A04_12550 [Paramagnetospirillum marisnigri]|uniref:Co-chaperone DjlA N-terminal domain-containing protein n=1 Tax=Paramagnetospirillum marisnigri TaxID=1285242 RepID=A0A178MXD3_9PROT|nr:hypothetical protein [Paramagnetospirillum marisnigri]OAN54069.1 hypothetical protein A6A04_12550 [Paramagnetospirillum marisnigri]
MYMQYLNEEQRKSLLVMAFRMVMADKLVHPEEKSIMDALKAELGITSVSRADFEAGAQLDAFASRRSQIAAMLKLSSIAYCDAVFRSEEVKVLVEYGRAFELSIDDMKAIDAWGKMHHALITQAAALLDLAGQQDAAAQPTQ